MVKRTTAPKKPKRTVKTKSAAQAKGTVKARSGRQAKNNTATKAKAGRSRRTPSRTENAMSTSILEGPMKSVIAEALLKRK